MQLITLCRQKVFHVILQFYFQVTLLCWCNPSLLSIPKLQLKSISTLASMDFLHPQLLLSLETILNFQWKGVFRHFCSSSSQILNSILIHSSHIEGDCSLVTYHFEFVSVFVQLMSPISLIGLSLKLYKHSQKE